MFTLYHSNQLDLLKELLVSRIRQAPLSHPFDREQILVQSPGMAQWLKLELAKAFGIAANIDFPLPASFIWEMFTRVLADVPRQSPYNKGSMSWQLMTILPALLDRPPLPRSPPIWAVERTRIPPGSPSRCGCGSSARR